jgi:hypothetical protein
MALVDPKRPETLIEPVYQILSEHCGRWRFSRTVQMVMPEIIFSGGICRIFYNRAEGCRVLI